MARKQPASVRQKKRLRLAYVLLITAAVVIGIGIAALQHSPDPELQTISNNIPNTSNNRQPQSAIEETALPKVEKYPETVSVQKTTAATMKGRQVALVLDDVGNSLEELEPFLHLPMKITFAVMPGRRFTEESVNRIKDAGQMYIIHQPMEPEGDADPGVGAIYSGMTREEVFTVLDTNLSGLDGAAGMNNHMGSKVTADEEIMSYILSYLKEKNMFFLDSLTTGKSVAGEIAGLMDVPFIKRNSMFLDNTRERDYIERALRSGFSIAEKSGRAVMIGHVWDEHLAELLLELFPEFSDAGFSFDDVGNMIYLGRQGQE